MVIRNGQRRKFSKWILIYYEKFSKKSKTKFKTKIDSSNAQNS